jgi:ARG and Rhodanese-Phosphatase-superfamily-associated Protein domain
MKITAFLATMVAMIVSGLLLASRYDAEAGQVAPSADYKVLAPIRHGNLTVFPVVASTSHDTGGFLTLDEGLRSGEVEVTESGIVRGMIRRRPPQGGVLNPTYPVRGGAQVNKLVLINNSKRPLLLLAGEIVTGGKQDRVIGKDRIVPVGSDPIDLDVFCVEPGRWVGHSEKFEFGSINGAMAAPSVRGRAMSEKDQQKVWAEVGKAKEGMAMVLRTPGPAAAPAPAAAAEVESTTSYAKVMQNDEVKTRVDSMARPIEQEYQSTIQQLRDRNAVGVVVAVNGEIVWADIFASTSLLEKYWPKLVRSYASEAVVTRAKGAQVSEKMAQAFLETLHGRHETVDSEPGVYRHTEVSGDGFKAFELTSLLPKTGFAVHVAKMAE